MSRNKHSAPRLLGGGRSLRHDRRHISGGYAREYAHEWSDAGAHNVLQTLHEDCATSGLRIGKLTLEVCFLGMTQRHGYVPRFSARLRFSAPREKKFHGFLKIPVHGFLKIPVLVVSSSQGV